jgi:hypothetical protein
MLAHQQMTWDVRIGTKARVGSSEWLRHLRNWLMHPTRRLRAMAPSVGYTHRAGRRAQFRPPTTEPALDYAAAQGGQLWAIMLYRSCL